MGSWMFIGTRGIKLGEYAVEAIFILDGDETRCQGVTLEKRQVVLYWVQCSQPGASVDKLPCEEGVFLINTLYFRSAVNARHVNRTIWASTREHICCHPDTE